MDLNVRGPPVSSLVGSMCDQLSIWNVLRLMYLDVRGTGLRSIAIYYTEKYVFYIEEIAHRVSVTLTHPI